MKKRLKPDRLLEVGTIHGPHGLKGALTIYSHTRPAIGIAGYFFWWLGNDAETAKPYKVERCWQHGRRILAKLDSVPDVARAEPFKDMKIWVDAADVAVTSDEYLWQDIIGCEVWDTDTDRLLGTVIALEAYGAQDTLVVCTSDDAKPAGEWLLPFVRDVVIAVDMDMRRITVQIPEGMDACFTPKS